MNAFCIDPSVAREQHARGGRADGRRQTAKECPRRAHDARFRSLGIEHSIPYALHGAENCHVTMSRFSGWRDSRG
jgi:hypothetical protein